MSSVDHTEAAWHSSQAPDQLLAIVERLGVGSPRKLRLAACACCRQFWGLVPGAARLVVELAELYAEGATEFDDLRDAMLVSANARWAHFWPANATQATADRRPLRALQTVVALLREPERPPRGHPPAHAAEQRAERSRRLCHALRDVFGNPFRPVVLLPAQLTRDVRSVAADLEGRQELERLAILGDALEEAGCTDEALLRHCREPGEHYRGCWALDAALGKS